MQFIIVWLLFSTVDLAALPSLLDVMSSQEAFIRTELVLSNKTAHDITGVHDLYGSFYYCPNPNISCPSVLPQDYELVLFHDSSLNTSVQQYL